MVKITSILASSALAACTFASLTTSTAAHETSTHRALSTDQRKLYMANAKHALGECADTDSYRRLQERAVERRAAAVQNIRRQRRLDNAEDVLATDHESSLTGVTADTSSSVLFGDEVSCILEPEVTYGPYYVSGEYIRSDMREDQAGLDAYVDLQVIDVSTCEPVTDMYVDFWHANATGVYSGVVAEDNGTGEDDPSNLNATFLRGLAPTDEDGVAQMLTIFPGHYTGRTTHLHMIGNYNGTVLDNGTYAGGDIAHVGQFFFDQDLITAVNELDTYVTDTWEVTLNEDDSMFLETVADGYDSIMEYALLGDSLEDGLFLWISVAVDMTASQEVQGAATLTANGGVATTTSANGGDMNGGSMAGGDFAGSMGGGDFSGSMGEGGEPSTGSEEIEDEAVISVACSTRK